LFAYTPASEEKLAVIMGNEVRGIAKQSLKHADHILHIPMQGKKESLNVGVAAGIALFTLLQ
jgi:TrmH family RNA methyltransferase